MVSHGRADWKLRPCRGGVVSQASRAISCLARVRLRWTKHLFMAGRLRPFAPLEGDRKKWLKVDSKTGSGVTAKRLKVDSKTGSGVTAERLKVDSKTALG